MQHQTQKIDIDCIGDVRPRSCHRVNLINMSGICFLETAKTVEEKLSVILQTYLELVLNWLTLCVCV